MESREQNKALDAAVAAVKAWMDDGAPFGEYVPYVVWVRRHRAASAIRALLGEVDPEVGEEITAWRATNRRAEHDELAAGAEIISRDHSDDSLERGLSVACGLHYAARGYRYVYRVTGRVVAQGADGEPVLVGARPVGPVMTAAKAIKADWAEAGEARRRQGLAVAVAAATGADTSQISQLAAEG